MVCEVSYCPGGERRAGGQGWCVRSVTALEGSGGQGTGRSVTALEGSGGQGDRGWCVRMSDQRAV